MQTDEVKSRASRRVGVLGSSGFVGAQVLGQLSNAGIDAVALPRLIAVERETNRASTKAVDLIATCDVVVNCAGSTQPEHIFDANVRMVADAAASAAATGATWIQLSSVGIFSNLEARLVGPTTQYEISKAAAELVLRETIPAGQLSLVRCAAIVGNGMAGARLEALLWLLVKLPRWLFKPVSQRRLLLVDSSSVVQGLCRQACQDVPLAEMDLFQSVDLGSIQRFLLDGPGDERGPELAALSLALSDMAPDLARSSLAAVLSRVRRRRGSLTGTGSA